MRLIYGQVRNITLENQNPCAKGCVSTCFGWGRYAPPDSPLKLAAGAASASQVGTLRPSRLLAAAVAAPTGLIVRPLPRIAGGQGGAAPRNAGGPGGADPDMPVVARNNFRVWNVRNVRNVWNMFGSRLFGTFV